MAICKECKGDRFDRIKGLYYQTLHELPGLFSSEYELISHKDGAMWQCRKCKRVFYYPGVGWENNGLLPVNEEEV